MLYNGCSADKPHQFSTCTVVASTVQLYYWPETTQSGAPASCDDSGGVIYPTVAPPNGTRVATITLDSPGGGQNATRPNMTLGVNASNPNVLVMTSPSVYLAIQGVSAVNSYNVMFQSKVGSVGSAHVASTVISYLPQHLSSIEQHISGFSGPWQSELDILVGGNYSSLTNVPRSYDLRNLQRPVPPSAYFFRATDVVTPAQTGSSFQSNTFYGPRDTTISNDYKAYIAVPSQLREMDPAWDDCILALGGIYDPPIPIFSASFVAASPTQAPIQGPNQPVSTSATPAPTATPPLPHPTTTSKPAVVQSQPGGAQPAPEPVSSVPFTQHATQQPVADPPKSDPPAAAPGPSDPASQGPAVANPPPQQTQNPGEPNPVAPQPANPSSAPTPNGAFGLGGSTQQSVVPQQPVPAAQNPAPQPVQPAANTQPSAASGSATDLQASAAPPAAPQVQPAANPEPASGSSGTGNSPQAPAFQPLAGNNGLTGQASDPQNIDIPDTGSLALGANGGSPAQGSADIGNVAKPEPIPAPAPPQADVQIAPGSSLQAQQATVVQQDGAVRGDAIAVAGSTILPGGAAATVSGQVISANPGGAINVGGSINVPLSTPPPPPAIPQAQPQTGAIIAPPAAGGSFVTALQTKDAQGKPAAIVQGNTINPGSGPATINNQVFSVNPQGQLLVQSTPGAAPSAVPFSALPVNTVGVGNAAPSSGAVFSAGAGNAPLTAIATTLPNGQKLAVVGSQTLAAGGAPLVTNGATFSAAPDGGIIAVSDGKTSTASPSALAPMNDLIPMTLAPGISGTSSAITGANGQTTPVLKLADGKLLSAGGSPVTSNGKTLSADSAGNVLVAQNGHTSTVPMQSSHGQTAASNVLYLDPGASVLVGPVSKVTGTDGKATPVEALGNGMTLTAGGKPSVVNGHTLSLASDGRGVLVDGTRSATLPTASAPRDSASTSGPDGHNGGSASGSGGGSNGDISLTDPTQATPSGTGIGTTKPNVGTRVRSGTVTQCACWWLVFELWYIWTK
ncbi:MAG: hypothetical protein Q9159_004884 [Coniocarpon cinnabarinum]